MPSFRHLDKEFFTMGRMQTEKSYLIGKVVANVDTTATLQSQFQFQFLLLDVILCCCPQPASPSLIYYASYQHSVRKLCPIYVTHSALHQLCSYRSVIPCDHSKCWKTHCMSPINNIGRLPKRSDSLPQTKLKNFYALQHKIHCSIFFVRRAFCSTIFFITATTSPCFFECLPCLYTPLR